MRARSLVLIISALVASGCLSVGDPSGASPAAAGERSEGSSSSREPSSGDPPEPSSTAAPGTTSTTPAPSETGTSANTSVFPRVLVELNWTYQNPALPGAFGNDVEITTFQLDHEAPRVEAFFDRRAAPLEFYATNVRIYGPADYFDQAALNNGQATLTVKGAQPGEWRLAYFVEHTEPNGQHEVYVKATEFSGEA